MSFNNLQQRFEYARQRLETQWTETGEMWRDEMRQNFQTQWYEPMQEPLRTFANGLLDLDLWLNKIERELPRT